MIQQNAELKRALEEDMDQDISVSGFKAPRAKEFSAEILAGVDKYDLVKHAQALSCKDILIIGGWRERERARHPPVRTYFSRRFLLRLNASLISFNAL